MPTNRMFVVVSMMLFSGCILCKDVSVLWSEGAVDESLAGTWKSAEAKDVIEMRFDITSTNMLLTYTSGDPHSPIRVGPLRCCTVKENLTGMSFLVVPDSYYVFTSLSDSNIVQDLTGMGVLVAYKVKEGKAGRELVFYSHRGEALAERIATHELDGGAVREGGNPPSRATDRPFLENPTRATVRVIASAVVSTNEPLLIMTRQQSPGADRGHSRATCVSGDTSSCVNRQDGPETNATPTP